MKQFTFYLIIGFIGSLIDLILFGVFTFSGFSTIMSQWLAALIGNSHNHLWQFFYIFDHEQGFAKTYALTLLLAGVLILISGPLLIYVDSFVQNIWLSKAILFPTIGLIGYLVRKTFIYYKG